MNKRNRILLGALIAIAAGAVAYLGWSYIAAGGSRPGSRSDPNKTAHTIPAEVQQIVREKQAVIDRIPHAKESGAILDAVCKAYLKNNLKEQSDNGSNNSALLMMIEDFPDSRLGGYACEKLIINDATLRQNVLMNIERIIAERPTAPTNVCLLSRYLHSPLPQSFEEPRNIFCKKICASSADTRAGYECMKYLASYYKSGSDTAKQAEYLELMLKHNPKQFLVDGYGAELARIYSASARYESLDKYESLLKTAPGPEPGGFSDFEKLEYSAAVLKSEHKTASDKETKKAAFWRAYSTRDENGLISFITQADHGKEYFLSLTALGDRETDSSGGRQYYEKIVAESEPFSIYSEQALQRLKASMRPEDDPTSAATGIIRLCANESSADAGLAKTCAIYHGLGCSDHFIRESEKYLQQYPAGRNAPDLLSVLFIHYLKKKSNLKDAIRCGRELFADPANAARYANTYAQYLEALALAHVYDELVKMSVSSMPHIQDSRAKRQATRIAELALFCQAMRNNGKPALNGFNPANGAPADQGVYAVYDVGAADQARSAPESTGSDGKEILDQLFENPSHAFTANDYAAIRAFCRTRDDHQALRILLSGSDISRPEAVDDMKYLAQNPDSGDILFFSLLLSAFPKSDYYRTRATDEQTSANTIYSLYCLALVNNRSAGDEERAVAQLYECGGDIERLGKYESRHGDTFYSGKAAHQIAIFKQNHDDYLGALSIYKDLPSKHPAYGIKDSNEISQQVSQYMALNYCAYLAKESSLYLDLDQYDNARSAANMTRLIISGVTEKPGSKKLAAMAAEEAKKAEAILSECDSRAQAVLRNALDIQTADLVAFKRQIDSYKNAWTKLTDLKALSEKYLKDNQLDDDIVSLSVRYSASSKMLDAKLKTYEESLYQYRKDTEIPVAMESLGNVYELLDGFTASTDMYERYLGKCSDRGLRLRLLSGLAEKYDSNNSSNQAIRYYRQIVEEYAADPVAAAAQKAILTIYNEKLKLADKAVDAGHFLYEHYQNTPEGREALFTVGKIYYENKKPQNAIYEFTRCLGIISDEQQKNSIRLLIALSYMQLQDYDTCRAQLKEVIAKSNVEAISTKAHYLMGYSFLVEQKYPEAKQEFEILQSRYPASREAADAKSFVQKLGEAMKR